MNVIAIINITNNSLSSMKSKKNIIHYIKTLAKYNIIIVDIGAQSTNPNNPRQLKTKEEKKRLNSILQKAIKVCNKNNILISIDSYKEPIIRYVLKQNIDIINDQQGIDTASKAKLIYKNKKQCIAMHSITLPGNNHDFISNTEDITDLLYNWCQIKHNQLINYKIPKENIILDIGIGLFGKNNQQSWNLLKNINKIRKIDIKLLIGHSYKGFLREIGNKDNITIIVSIYLREKKIDFIRIHNIQYHYKIINKLYN